MEGSQKIRLRVNNGPDVHAKGVLLHEYTTQSSDRPKDRWTELRLWETEGGAWIAEKVGCSTRQGEAEIRDVLVIENVTTEWDDLLAQPQLEDATDKNHRAVVEFFGWTVVAKAFAKQAGWDVVRRVD